MKKAITSTSLPITQRQLSAKRRMIAVLACILTPTDTAPEQSQHRRRYCIAKHLPVAIQGPEVPCGFKTHSSLFLLKLCTEIK